MPSTTLFYLFFGSGLLLGCTLGTRMLIRYRRTITAPDLLYQWYGGRLSSWKYEPHTSTAILVHTLAVASIAAAALVAARKPPSFIYSLLADDATMIGLLWFVECGSLALTGYLLGTLLAFPVSRFDKKPVAYGVSEQGIAHGRIFMPWRWFSRFTLDPNQRLLRLYSAYASDLPNLTLVIPDSLALGEVHALLLRHLAQAAAATGNDRYHTRRTYVLAMLLLSMLSVGFGWLAALLQRELALFLIALCTGLLAALGGLLIALYGFGVIRAVGR